MTDILGQMSATSSLTIGIDIGGTNLRAAVVSPDGQILDVEQLPTPSSVEALEKGITLVVSALRERHEVSAVGLAVAGFITAEQDRVRFAPHLPWRDSDVRDRLSSRLGLPVVLEHDANAAAWGENILGPGQDASTWVLFAVGTGIGGALVQDGVLYRGAYGTAPEFGHLTVVPGGRACPCGKRGCLERYVSGSGLAMIHARCGGDDLDASVVVASAQTGDAVAQKALAIHRDLLGYSFASLILALDPHVIVLGGGLSKLEQLYRDLPAAIAPYLFAGVRVPPILPPAFGDAGGARGAALLARQHHPSP